MGDHIRRTAFACTAVGLMIGTCIGWGLGTDHVRTEAIKARAARWVIKNQQTGELRLEWMGEK